LDRAALRAAIRSEYAAVATDPSQGFHFHTGRGLAKRLGYPAGWVDPLPESAVESFAGVGNPFAQGHLRPGERVLDLGCGAGFDCILAAGQVGPAGSVIGVDMTPAMLEKARASAAAQGLGNLDLRQGYIENLPVERVWVDVVISNGIISLNPDKETVFAEVMRVLKPGGRSQIADIVVTRPIPEAARKEIDLWTG